MNAHARCYFCGQDLPVFYLPHDKDAWGYVRVNGTAASGGTMESAHWRCAPPQPRLGTLAP